MEEKRREAEMGSTLDYFSLLGVSQDASQDEIEARYRELSEHLASAAIPPALKDWAAREAALVDEAYAILSDPELRADLERGGPRPAPAAPKAAEPAAEIADDSDDLAEFEPAPAPRPAAQERPVSAAKALLVGVPWKLMAFGAAIGLAVLGVVFVGGDLLSGGGNGDDASVAEENGLQPIDTERVAELMALIQEDPKNAEATFELGEIYFLGGEWQASVDWYTKLLELEPTNVVALIDVGTAQFQLANYEEAKASWLKAGEVDPNEVQVHYNLGYLYATVEPVDYAAALSEWQSVIDLAPGSDLAEVAQVHLESLAGEASGEASPAPTEAPAGS